MKTAKIKSLVFSGIILLATSFTFGQSTAGAQKSGGLKHHKSITPPQYSNTQQVSSSGNNVNDAGSSAQVRYERIGSLCPGNVSNVGPDRYKPENTAPSTRTKRQKQ